MSRALLVDTNFSSWPILQALERQGLEVHVVGVNPQDTLARNCACYHPIDYSDSVALSRLIDHLKPNYLVPGCNDISYIACAKAAHSSQFIGIDSLENTETINNKARFRETALRFGLSMPKILHWPQEAPQGSVIIKPVDAFSGKGVTLLMDPSPKDIDAARQIAIGVSRCGECIVEEFVDGQMYSHSAFISGSRIVHDFWVIEHSSANPFVVDISHLELDLENTIKEGLRAEIEFLVRELGLVDGLFHTQFIVSGSRFAIVESTRRCPGDLYSQLIQLSTGFDYADAYAASFTGKQISATNLKPRSILRHTLTGTTTTNLQHLSFSVPLKIERWVPLATCAEELLPSPQGRIALLFAQANDPSELQSLASKAVKRELFEINQK